MQRVRSVWGAFLLTALFVLQSISQLALYQHSEQSMISDNGGIEWVQFELRDDVFNDAIGIYDNTVSSESRDLIADTIIGSFDESGLIVSRPISAELLQPRPDLQLALISNELNLLDARAQIDEITGLEIREFIAPSGFVVQGTEHSFNALANLNSVAVLHEVPIALIMQSELLDILLLEDAEDSLIGQRIRIEGWRGKTGLQQSVLIDDGFSLIKQDIAEVVDLSLNNSIQWDIGRFEGDLIHSDIISITLQPSVRTIRFNPVFEIDNNNAVSHMQSSNMQIYFNTDLDGSGQTIAVADSGLDHDHGDFGNRIVANNDVINDGSTADRWSGHGTHVSCTVLGDGTRGSYQGVVPAAKLYFQAMENDASGNFQSPSLNSLINSAYNGGARTHTNSWGNDGGYGQYNSESQDVDDRANYYDKYYNGREGLTILFAAGNDGPNPDSITPPATAKNVITVGMHQNRYQGSPDYIMDGSSRGPVDDGRIKPDVLAPGGYVRSCRAQEAGDTGGASWYSSDNWYLEYTGTSMATPNAAGAAAMIREYLEEIALRDSPQGALVKALLILGAEDIGNRDIPNNDEGWGRVNVRNSLAPPAGQGVWVDDRSYLSATGNSKSYDFYVDSAGDQFKAVLTWSDEYASTWSSTQLVNNLNLRVTDPNGVVYLGNDFANGRSTTGGSADSINNVEAVLVDSAVIGSWTVEIIDGGHGGSTAQPFALAVMGHGLNDLKPDLVFLESGFDIDIEIPTVGQDVELICALENSGNIRTEQFTVTFEVDGTIMDTQSLYLDGGSSQQLAWDWIPQSHGENTLSFIIDKNNLITESLETNNRLDVEIDVSNPGVSITSDNPILQLLDAEQTSTSWEITIQNTGLLETTASISKSPVVNLLDNSVLNWYVGLEQTNYILEGMQSVDVSVTMVYPKAPQPGTYRVDLTVQDIDNDLSQSYSLELLVGEVPNIDLRTNYDVVPVHPIETSIVPIYLYNTGNTDIAYQLQVQPNNGWNISFIQGSTSSQFASSLPIDVDAFYAFEMVIQPPADVRQAGTQAIITISVTSQTESPVNWMVEVPIEVEPLKQVEIRTDTTLTNLVPSNDLVMVFTLENKGNVDVELSPTFILPQGVEMVSNPGTINLPISTTELYIVTLKLLENSRSGQATIHFDNGSDRFTWQQLIEVQVYPMPSLEFQKVIYPDGQEYNITFYGTGSHPAGSELQFFWTLTNSEDIMWQPVVKTTSDSKLSVNCENPTAIGFEESTNLSCVVITNPLIEPFTEPEFTIQLTGSNAYFSETFSLYIGGYEQLTWSDLSSKMFNQGEEKQVQIKVTNSGTLPFNHMLTTSSNEDWKVKVVGDGIIDLQVGESKTIKFAITPTTGGTSDILFEFSTVDSEVNVNYAFTANAETRDSDSSSLGVKSLQIGLIIAVVIVIFVLVFLLLKPNNRSPSHGKIPHPVNHISMHTRIAPPLPSIPSSVIPATVINTPNSADINQSPTPIGQNMNPALVKPSPNSVVDTKERQLPVCWNCRDTIIVKAIGCPKCGARYHSQSSDSCNMDDLEFCLSCNSPALTFVSE